MKIKRIDVDGCGVLTGTSLELGDGLVIILDDNEAGKTTLLRSLHAGFCRQYDKNEAVVQQLQRRDDPRRNPMITLVVGESTENDVEWTKTYKPSDGVRGRECLFQSGQAEQITRAADAEAAYQQFIGEKLIGPLSVLLDPNWTAGFKLEDDAASCLQDILNEGPGGGLAEQILADVTNNVDKYWTAGRNRPAMGNGTPMRVADDDRTDAQVLFDTLNTAFQAAAGAGERTTRLETEKTEAKQTFLSTCQGRFPTSQPNEIWAWLDNADVTSVSKIVASVGAAGSRRSTLLDADEKPGGPWLSRLDLIGSQWRQAMLIDLHEVRAAISGSIAIESDNAILHAGDPPEGTPSTSVVVELPGVLHVKGERLKVEGQCDVDQEARSREWLECELPGNPFDTIASSIELFDQLDVIRRQLGGPAAGENGYQAELKKIDKTLADLKKKVCMWPPCLRVLTEDGPIDRDPQEAVTAVISSFEASAMVIRNADTELRGLQAGGQGGEIVTQQQVDEANANRKDKNAAWKKAEDTADALLHLEETLKAHKQNRQQTQARFPGFAGRVRSHLTRMLPGSDRVVLGLNTETAAPEDIYRDAGQLNMPAGVAASLVSQGTREQIDIAVRLAYAQCLSGCDEPALFKTGAPLVIDDALVHTDDARLGRAVELLVNAATDEEHPVQVILATASPRLVDEVKRVAKELGKADAVQVVSLCATGAVVA